MKKLKYLLSVMMILSLFTGTLAGANSSYESKPVPKKDRHMISEIVDSESKWEKVATGHGFMEGINFDRKENIWMVSPMTGEVMTVKGNQAVTVGEKKNMPVGAKFHKDGRLFITDVTGGLYAVNTTTGERTLILDSFKGEKFKGLNDLVFDETGGLYFTEPIGSHALNPVGRVFYLPAGSTEPVIFANNIAYPNGIAISANGNRVYVSEFGTNRVISIPSKTAPASPETPFVFGQFEGGIGPDGLAVDKAGNLYVAHFQAGEIVVLDESGFKYGTIRLPEDAGTFVTNLTFHKGYLYVTESSKNEVWRIKVKNEGVPLYGLQ